MSDGLIGGAIFPSTGSEFLDDLSVRRDAAGMMQPAKIVASEHPWPSSELTTFLAPGYTMGHVGLDGSKSVFNAKNN